MIETKKCNLCLQVKSLEDFYYQTKENSKGEECIYYNPRCKKCVSNKSKMWRRENYDRYLENERKYNLTEKKKRVKVKYGKTEKKKKRQKKWFTENKNKLNTYQRDRMMHKTHKITNMEWEDCKKYFNHRCAYCGLPIEDHYIQFRGRTQLGDFHKEHVIHDGENDLSNCIPACKNCNSQKWLFKLEDWYNERNEVFSYEKLEKINKWLNEDYKRFLQFSNGNLSLIK